MINYELPNGKTIRISIETLLSLDEHNIHELSHSNAGSSTRDPFDEKKLKEDDYYYEDNTLDIEDPDIDIENID